MSVEELQERLKTGRNEPCPCGSGKKYKKCHRAEDEQGVHAEVKRREQAVEAEAAASSGGEDDGDEARAKDDGLVATHTRSSDSGRQRGAAKSRSVNTPPKNLPRRRAV